jgi:pimeloyl-ACP methyl ester carboxylesterase
VVALILTLIWTGGLAWLIAVAATAWVLLRPPRMTPARAMARLGRMSPSDLHLRSEDAEFWVRDAASGGRKIRIVAWWLPASDSSDVTVVLIHGYADSRIGALAWADPLIKEIGVNVLAVDLRAHGESGGSFTTAGLRERFDLEQIVNDLRAARPAETVHIYLMGLSMGAAVALAAAAELGDGTAGVIVDSPVADFYHGAATQLSLMGLAGKSVLLPGLRLTEMLLGERFTSIRPDRLIRDRLRCPVLALVPGGGDPFLPHADAHALSSIIADRAAEDGRSEWVTFPTAGHLLALQQDPAEFDSALNRFCRTGKSDRLARASAASRSADG